MPFQHLLYIDSFVWHNRRDDNDEGDKRMRDIDWKLEYESLEREIENMMQKTLIRYEKYEAEVETLNETISDLTKKVGQYARDIKKLTEEKVAIEQETAAQLEQQQQKYKGLHARYEESVNVRDATIADAQRLERENETLRAALDKYESSMWARFIRKEVRG